MRFLCVKAPGLAEKRMKQGSEAGSGVERVFLWKSDFFALRAPQPVSPSLFSITHSEM